MLNHFPLFGRLRIALALLRGRYTPPALADTYFALQESSLFDSVQRGLEPATNNRFRWGILTRKHHGLGVIEVT